MRLALDEIRAYGADSVQVMRRMKALIQNLTAVLPAERQAALRHWEKHLQGSIARSFTDAEKKREPLWPTVRAWAWARKQPLAPHSVAVSKQLNPAGHQPTLQT